ncbi:YhzD family protein [Aliibacillus thermotolerans]|uniref:YhzD family protein n=1 Tax=Aliibacillus thermotolerans TaxID=1834418 RepID=A0ABW0U902_9BACI|nr:YhzD family protein [Aliibacillus thermotolerans]MDA3128578.1 hypothetical protein [Aliibacillus thermotolerans]
MQYFLTAFDKDGTLLLNETFEFDRDEEAKQHGRKRLQEEQVENKTFRLVRNGKIIMFKR